RELRAVAAAARSARGRARGRGGEGGDRAGAGAGAARAPVRAHRDARGAAGVAAALRAQGPPRGGRAGMTTAADLRAALDEGALSPFQVRAILLCVALNMLDGFDVLVMAFTASEVAREWTLSGAWLGVLLSAGLVGMAAGSLFVAPWADRFGRRAVTLCCLVVITAGMLLSALARGPLQLGALRALPGTGVAGILASLNVITSEYASRRWRSAAISLQFTGYPIGATIGGSIAAVLITWYGWRSAFLFGAAASAAMIPLV